MTYNQSWLRRARANSFVAEPLAHEVYPAALAAEPDLPRPTHDLPVWIPCGEGCQEFHCRLHLMHAMDCPCPPIEEWAVSPYEPQPRPAD